MESQNPYAAPNVEETLHFPKDEVLFEYRFSSRNPWLVLGSLPLLLIIGVAILQSVSMWIISPQPYTSSDQLAALMALVLLVGFGGFLLASLVFPRVWSLKVDRMHVSWCTPWPRESKHQLDVTDIERVEFQGAIVTIATTNGQQHMPPIRTYDSRREEVVEAIKAAIAEREPNTRVLESRSDTSVSLMRRLGQGIRSMIRRD